MEKSAAALSIVVSLLLISCASSLRPYQTQRTVKTTFKSKTGQSLLELPRPEQKIVAAVYGFRDQTGQYKPSARSVSYSTAVTQGATSILIKALEQSGWFIPIERAGISNLLNERRIIRSTRKQNNDPNKLQPLLFAGILLEGGIIGYDANVVTSGAGVRFLGMGTSGQFRKDQVTVYLRAVSTQTGRILKSVRTTKSIVSQKLQGGIFRYVDANRLLESEIGVTFNEPSVTAVREAVNAAVRKLIIEGVEENLWNPESAQAFQEYQSSHQFSAKLKNNSYIDVYGLKHHSDLREGFLLTTNFTYGSYIGSYTHEIQSSGILAQLEQFISPVFSLKLSYQRTVIGAKKVFSHPINNLDLLLSAYLTPDFNLSPYLSAGGGVAAYTDVPDYANGSVFPAFSAGAGLDYHINESLGFRIGINYRYLLSGGVDGVTVGSINDQQWSFITGISFF